MAEGSVIDRLDAAEKELRNITDDNLEGWGDVDAAPDTEAFESSINAARSSINAARAIARKEVPA